MERIDKVFLVLTVGYILCVVFFYSLCGCEETGPEPPPPELEPAVELECLEASDCGTGYPECYVWSCVDNECVYELDDGKCSEGYECRAIVGCIKKPSDIWESNCETDDDCPGFDCAVGKCLSSRCFYELHDELCLPYWKCTTAGCVRDSEYYDDRCYSDADCADGVSCTRDACALSSHQCIHAPSNDLCPGDLVCDMMRGCIEIF